MRLKGAAFSKAELKKHDRLYRIKKIRMKSFYQKIQDKLYAHRSSVDTDDLWQHINSELHPKKDRRFLFWWGLGALLLLSGGFAIWQFSSASLSKQDILVSTPIAEVKLPSDLKAPLSPSHSVEDKQIDVDSDTEKAIASPTIENTTGPLPQKIAPKLSQTLPITILSANQKTPLLLSKEEGEKQAPLIDTETITLSSNQFSNKTINEEKSSQVKDNPVRSPLLSAIPIYSSKAEASSFYTPQFKEVVPFTFSKKNKSNAIEMGIHSSLFRPTRQFRTPAKYQSLLNDRIATETPLEAIELGLNISYFPTEGFYLRTGLSFTQINERFDWQSISYSRDTLTGVLLLVELDEQGDTLSKSIGLGQGTTTTSYQAKIYNSIRLLDLPLIIGYRFQSSAWHFGLETGVYFNLLQTAEGRILDINRQVRKLETTSVLKKRIGLSLYGAIRISYQLTDQWAISFAPNLRYQLGKNTRDEYELEQWYHLLGMQMGVGYVF